MLRITMIGMMAVFLAMVLKKDKAEFGLLVILGACVVILGLSLSKVEEVVGAVRKLEGYLGQGSLYIGVLLKMVGITYVAEFGASLCSDAGYQAVAGQVEVFGEVMIMAGRGAGFLCFFLVVGGIL